MGHFLAEMDRLDEENQCNSLCVSFQLGHFLAEMDRLSRWIWRQPVFVFQLGHFLAEMDSMYRTPAI